jgi:hypothetical protein
LIDQRDEHQAHRGFERQMANHLGHAALVAALWPLLHASAARGSSNTRGSRLAREVASDSPAHGCGVDEVDQGEVVPREPSEGVSLVDRSLVVPVAPPQTTTATTIAS